MDVSPPSEPSPIKRGAVLLLAWIFETVFVLAGVLKVLDPGLFTLQVRSFEMLPDPYNAVIALSLPWLEIFCGLAVITGWLRVGGLLLLNAVLLVFIGVLGWALAHGKQVDCGCFGSAGHLSQPQELALDAALLLIGLGLLLLSLQRKKSSRISAPPVVEN